MRPLDRKQFKIAAHWSVVATAAAMPWSTSLVSILLGVWLVLTFVSLQWRDLREDLLTPVGGLPVLLVLFALFGTMWADAGLDARWEGFASFLRLLAIPLLMAQYRRSGRGDEVLVAFLLSCTLLLAVSYLLYVFPQLPQKYPGVPVKTYVTQSLEFAIVAALLLDRAIANWRQGDGRRAAGIGALAAAFVVNICAVATGRTTLVVLAALVLVYGFRHARWKGAVVGALLGLVVFGVAWQTSDYLRERVSDVYSEIKGEEQANLPTSSGLRLIFWRKALRFIEAAPIIGRGIGSIKKLYDEAAAGRTGAQGELSTNPHNQTLTVGVELGGIGILLLWSIWISQLVFFRGPGFVMWAGTVLVVQNVVGSAFNSLMFDFTEGWIYIFGVGVATGMARRAIAAANTSPAPQRAGVPN